MAGARGLTIGEAAARLALEFPGVTVAVLRRLEAGGRLAPSRAASGYRRYSAADLERAREILAQTREAAAEPRLGAPGRSASRGREEAAGRGSVPGARGERGRRAEGHAAGGVDAAGAQEAQSRSAAGDAAARSSGGPKLSVVRSPGSATVRALADSAERAASGSGGCGGAEADGGAGSGGARAVPAQQSGANQAGTNGFAMRRGERRWPEAAFFAPDLGEVSLDPDQLAAAARMDREWVDGLAEYGLLRGAPLADGADLLVAKAAAELAQYGVEPRHLRQVAASAVRVAELVAAVASGRREPKTGELRVDGIRAGGPAPGGAAEVAAATVRLHAALVRAALLRG